MSGSAIEIIGGNTIGEKAEMLVAHEPVVSEAGLEIPRTTVIAEEALQPFKKNKPEDQIDAAQTPSSIGRLVTYVSTRYAESPILAIRSSGEGDAIGTGTYESVFTENASFSIPRGLERVLRSFDSQKAQDFRRQAVLGQGFAVMVQPLIGQVLDKERGLIGPVFSGTGYSETDDDLYGMINLVAGLGGGVERPGAEKINYADLSIAEALAEAYLVGSAGKNISLYDYVRIITEEQKTPNILREVTDFRDIKQIQREDGLYHINGLALRRPDDGIYKPEMHRISLGAGIKPPYEDAQPYDEPSLLIDAMRAFQPQQILDAMQDMEEIAGYPLYIEWALTVEQGRLRPVVLQIAPRELSPRAKIEAEVPKDLVVVAKNIRGHGIVNSSKIVYCPSTAEIDSLIKFNQDLGNEGYILVYPARLTSAENYGKLRYEDFSNAAVIIETNSNVHGCGKNMTDHIAGAMESTGKIYGEFDHFKFSDAYARLRILLSSSEDFVDPDNVGSGSIKIVDGDFKVIADESQDRLYIGKN